MSAKKEMIRSGLKNGKRAPEQRYLALIGDLIGSRQIAGRDQAQRQLGAALKALNRAHADLMASPLTLTLGDEFQALLYPKAGVMRLVDELGCALKAFPFRLGLGYGAIRTAIDPTLSIGADGECYWNAREALQYVHDNDSGGKSQTRVRGFGGRRDALLCALLETSDLIKYGWTSLQRDTFFDMLRQDIYTDNFDQQAFAARIGISPSGLSKRLSLGNIKLYIRTRLLIDDTMEAWHHEAK